MKKFIHISIIIILFSIGGYSIQNQKSQQKKQATTKMLHNWRLDTNGCLGYRNMETAIYIQDSIDFTGKDTSYIYNLLGKPNESYKGPVYFEIIYICNITCENNKVREDVDLWYLTFSIDSDNDIAVIIVCE
jgi:hypothetical protein